MPMTNSGVRIINPVLSSLAQGYSNEQFAGYSLFPRVTVTARGGQIIEFGREAFQRYASKRQPGGQTARVQFGYLGKPFGLANDALDVPLPREHMQDAQQVPGLDLGQRAVSIGMRNSLMSLEIDQALLATTAANYGPANKVALTGSGKWSNAAGLPAADIKAGREVIRQSCGLYPNVALMSALAFNAATENPSVLDRFKYGGVQGITSAEITEQMLAGLFKVKKVVVGAAIYYNDAGVATDIWGNNVVLAYVPPQITTAEEPSYGYTYTLGGDPSVEEPWYDHAAKSWVYGVSHERSPVLSGMACGYLIQNPA